jgi:hypothetical protein
MIFSDRHSKLRDGLPSVVDQRGCFLREQHQNSWHHHAGGELCCRCTRHDSFFGVRPRRQLLPARHTTHIRQAMSNTFVAIDAGLLTSEQEALMGDRCSGRLLCNIH